MTKGGETRFRKGQSGNPNGRPRRKRALPEANAFAVVTGLTLTVTQNGAPTEMSVDEALQYRTYQDAISGSRLAQRTILKMIVRREKWFAANSSSRAKPATVRWVDATDPDNAHDALVLLGIATRDTRTFGPDDPYDRLLLEPWAVDAAVLRNRRRELSEQDRIEIRRCTRDGDMIV